MALLKQVTPYGETKDLCPKLFRSWVNTNATINTPTPVTQIAYSASTCLHPDGIASGNTTYCRLTIPAAFADGIQIQPGDIIDVIPSAAASAESYRVNGAVVLAVDTTNFKIDYQLPANRQTVGSAAVPAPIPADAVGGILRVDHRFNTAILIFNKAPLTANTGAVKHGPVSGALAFSAAQATPANTYTIQAPNGVRLSLKDWYYSVATASDGLQVLFC